MPEAADECVLDAYFFSSDLIGQKIQVADNNTEDTKDTFTYQSYTVVGTVTSPYYINRERGTTTLGDGKIAGYIYIPLEGFSYDYYTEGYVKIDSGADVYTDAYSTDLESHQSELEETVEKVLEKRQARLLTEGEEKIADAKVTLASAKQELLDARVALDDGWAQLEDGEADYADGLKEWQDSAQKITDGETEIADNEKKLADAKKQLEDARKQLDSGEAGLSSGAAQLQSSYTQLQALNSQIGTMETALTDGKVALGAAGMDTSDLAGLAQRLLDGHEQYEQLYAGIVDKTSVAATALQAAETAYQTYYSTISTLAQIEAALPTMKTQYQSGMAQYQAGAASLSENQAKINAANASYLEGLTEYEDGVKKLQIAKEELEDGKVQLADGKKELEDAAQKLADSKAELEDGEKEYADGLREYNEEEPDALSKIADGESQLAELENLSTYVFTRKVNNGYASLENDSMIVEGVARVFPIFFFLIAALVCSTTMTRMVDDERTQIGTLRALGYSETAILSKYTIYSGLAAVIGAILGYIAGIHLFPYTIWTAYGMLYGFAPITYVVNVPMLILSLAAALVCSVGTTFFACKNALRSTPADLIRPKAPAAGKRILLEKMSFIWKKMKFLHKVSARNIFRFKKRMLMMILGIGGCTALVITGFGIKDSVSNIVNYQFGEIMKYDLSAMYTEPIEEDVLAAIEKNLGSQYEETTLLSQGSATATNADTVKTVYMLISDSDNFGNFMDLHHNGSPVAFPQMGEVAINEKLAESMGVQIGDTIALEYDDQLVELIVSGVFENYVYNYAVLSGDTYSTYFGQSYEPDTIYFKLSEDADEYGMAAYLSDMDNIANVSVTSSIKTRVTEMMSMMNYVVFLVIACAGALAFVVLFNLSNINITERVREIATLKVLGFYRSETGSYIFRENMVLSIMGMIAGIPLGIALHRFVISQIKVDMVTFESVINWKSYVLSMITVLGFTIIVDLLMRRKIDKIKMAESLKSIE